MPAADRDARKTKPLVFISRNMGWKCLTSTISAGYFQDLVETERDIDYMYQLVTIEMSSVASPREYTIGKRHRVRTT